MNRRVVSMNKTTKIVFGVVLAALLMVCTIPASATTFDGNESDLYCYQASVTPTIDGNISAGEWTDADSISWFYTPDSNHHDADIYCYAKWDASYLYLMVDLCPDNTTEDEDYCDISLDENHNGNWGYGADWEHAFDIRGNGFTGILSVNHEELGMGGGFEIENDTLDAFMGFATSSHAAWEHRIIEFRVGLDQFNVSDEMGILFDGYGTLTPNYFSVEDGNPFTAWNNETVANWTTIHMMDAEKTTFGGLTTIVVAFTGVMIAAAVLLGIVKIFKKSFKGIK
jgi:hypothetical protein